jgi:hypothetical protein
MPEISEARSIHYREMAIKLRGLARETDWPSARRYLIDIAKWFDRAADHADSVGETATQFRNS